MAKVKGSFASSFCNKSHDKIQRKGAKSCLWKSSSTSHYSYPGSFAEEEPTTAHQQPKSTVCSPPHVLNPPCHRPVVGLPKWLHTDITRRVPVNFRILSIQTEQKQCISGSSTRPAQAPKSNRSSLGWIQLHSVHQVIGSPCWKSQCSNLHR